MIRGEGMIDLSDKKLCHNVLEEKSERPNNHESQYNQQWSKPQNQFRKSEGTLDPLDWEMIDWGASLDLIIEKICHLSCWIVFNLVLVVFLKRTVLHKQYTYPAMSRSG